MPESMTATITPGSPVVVFQAALASMSASFGWSKPHCVGQPRVVGRQRGGDDLVGLGVLDAGLRSSRGTRVRDREVGLDEPRGRDEAERSLVWPTMAARARALVATPGAGAEADDDAARGGRPAGPRPGGLPTVRRSRPPAAA